tara:strand:+ start:39 stop:320 length:282 start_codon:yes stop_codon:yes gene_type:complete
MSWENAIKKQETVGEVLEYLIGQEGGLAELMKKISEHLPEIDDVKIISSSSSRPILAFNLPIFVKCEFGSKDFPSNTEVFTIKNIGINETQIK